jgi:hypothetical protein
MKTELLTRLEGYKKQRVTLLQKENPIRIFTSRSTGQ